STRYLICMARPMPPVSLCVPWPCSGTSTPTELVRAAMTRLVARRSTTSTASSTIPTGATTCSSPPPWEVANYEPRNPIESALLIARIVENDRDRQGRMRPRQQPQQLAHRLGGHVRQVLYRQDLFGCGMQGRQHIQALAAARRFDKHTRETPDQGQKGCIHEMRGIHKED